LHAEDEIIIAFWRVDLLELVWKDDVDRKLYRRDLCEWSQSLSLEETSFDPESS
jgi:hypothetical protein